MRRFCSIRSFFLQSAFGLLLLFAISDILPGVSVFRFTLSEVAADQAVVGDVAEDGAPVPGKLKFATWNIKKLGYAGKLDREGKALKIIANVLSRYHLIVITELMHVNDLEQVLGVEEAVIIKWKDGKLMKLKACKFQEVKSGGTLHLNNFKDSDFTEVEVKLKRAKDSRWDFDQVLEILSDEGRNYACLISPKVGTNSPERYAFLYDEEVISQLKDEGLYPDIENGKDDFVRDPYWATFCAGKFDFSVIAVHIEAGNMTTDPEEENKLLDTVYNHVRGINGDEEDVLLAGDFNMKYYKKLCQNGFDDLRINVNPEFTALFHWENKEHRTNIRGDELYDNIFFQRDHLGEYTGRSGVFCFEENLFKKIRDEELRFEFLERISDHRPVWAEFDLTDDD